MFSRYEKEKIKFLQIDSFLKTDLVNHCFTTKLGGVSEGIYESMNLRLNCDDKRENVFKNFDIIASAIGTKKEDMVLSNQIHEANVVRVGKKDRGNGLIYPQKYSSADALITNEKGVALVTFYADCVPVFLLDERKKAIGLVHSGWKGTILEIAKKTVEKMAEEFSSSPEDILTGIGPSIRACHFEVGEDVYNQFYNKFGEEIAIKKDNKLFVDLQDAVKKSLIEAGIKKENITDSKICTFCESDEFFSHRKTNGKRGSLAAILELKK